MKTFVSFVSAIVALGLLGLNANMTAAIAAPAASAPPVHSAEKSTVEFGDAHIETDEIDANDASGEFTMPHRITMTRPGSDVSGERARGNFKQRTITIDGNVVVHETKVEKPGDQPSTLTTDELTVDWGNKVYTAAGNVRFIQGVRTMSADHGTMNETTHDMQLFGNVHIDEGDRAASADHMNYNSESGDVKMRGIDTPAPSKKPSPRRSPGKPKP